MSIDKMYNINKYISGIYLDIQNSFKSIYKQHDIFISTGEIENPHAPQQEQK